MDDSTFDALARSVVTEAGPRRAVVRLLTGTVLGMIASRLSPVAGAAKAKPHKGQSHQTHQAGGHSSHRHQQRLHAHHHAQRGAQSEGKRKGKRKKNKGHQSPPLSPPPPGCQSCAACQMCQDGACVPNPALAGVPCQGSGSGCNHCFEGQCTPTDQPPCDDGTCAHRGSCCAGQQYCSDPTAALGFYCVGQNSCCDGKKKCGSLCISLSACCDAERPQCGACDTATCTNGIWSCGGTCCANEQKCGDGSCVAKTACCPGQKPCAGGRCIADTECCPGERPCLGGICAPTGTCCLEEKSCDGDVCIDRNQCCPEVAPPVCGECEVARCVAGSWDCWPDETCGPSCGEGFCPHGMTCHHVGTCCGTPTGGTYWTCVCASGYTGGAGCTADGQCCRQGCCYPYCCEDPRAG